MSDRQNNKTQDRSIQTEFNPGKFTFDLAAFSTVDDNAALRDRDKDKESEFVGGLQEIEVVDSHGKPL